MTRQKLIDGYATNSWLIGRLAEGVTPAESRQRLAPRLNSFNWVLGHIVQGRDRLIALLGGERVLAETTAAHYASGSPLLTDDHALPLPALLAAVEETQTRLAAAITAADDDALAALYDAERQITVVDRIDGVQWHETYHVGQLEILRQVGEPKPPFP